MSSIVVSRPVVLRLPVLVIPPGISDLVKFKWSGKTVILIVIIQIVKKQAIIELLMTNTLIDCRHSSESSISADICLDEASYAIDLV